jgi:SAM-dependent methyltransferase
MLSYTFPRPPGEHHVPVWTGQIFRLGERTVPVLEYSENDAGWTDELTQMHDETVGGDHPMDVASRCYALGQLSAEFGDREVTVLEVGCSSGFMLRDLKEGLPHAQIVGADVVKGPLEALARTGLGIPLLRFDLTRCPLESESCDAVVSLQVLEHIEDDVAALAQTHRILKPGGVAVIEVPAGPHLYDAYDRALKHFRRYRMSELLDKLAQTGFRVERRSHLGFLLYPAFAAVKRKNQWLAKKNDDDALVRQQASATSKSKLLSAAMRIELALGRLLRYPTGIRCLVVARKL